MNRFSTYLSNGDPNPRQVAALAAAPNGPFALRRAGGRAEGAYASIAEAVDAGHPGDAVVLVDGLWIAGYIDGPVACRTRTGKEIHAACSTGMSATYCGVWMRASASAMRVGTGSTDLVTCEKCQAAVQADLARSAS